MTVSEAFLRSLGWNDFFQAGFDDKADFVPGRITGQGRGHYQAQVSSEQTLDATITSKFQDAAKDPASFPAIGDWVALRRGEGNTQATIHRILSRVNTIQRKKSGAQASVQMIAANVDNLFIVSSMNEDFDLPRLGRYIELGREPACQTILLLTKSDLSANPAAYVDRFKASFKGVEALVISREDPDSMAVLQSYFTPGKTSLLLGSSGVGKSTLTNYLLGSDAQKTGAVTSEARGRHTTTARTLRFTRWGGLVIDTPGMQEVYAVAPSKNLQNDYSDIKDLELLCKFTNCTHKNEPGCALLAALKNGTLHTERWQQYFGETAQADPRRKKNKYSR